MATNPFVTDILEARDTAGIHWALANHVQRLRAASCSRAMPLKTIVQKLEEFEWTKKDHKDENMTIALEVCATFQQNAWDDLVYLREAVEANDVWTMHVSDAVSIAVELCLFRPSSPNEAALADEHAIRVAAHVAFVLHSNMCNVVRVEPQRGDHIYFVGFTFPSGLDEVRHTIRLERRVEQANELSGYFAPDRIAYRGRVATQVAAKMKANGKLKQDIKRFRNGNCAEAATQFRISRLAEGAHTIHAMAAKPRDELHNYRINCPCLDDLVRYVELSREEELHIRIYYESWARDREELVQEIQDKLQRHVKSTKGTLKTEEWLGHTEYAA